MIIEFIFQLQSRFNSFTKFYNDQYNHRKKLKLVHQLSKGDLEMLCTKEKYVLQV